MCKENREMFTHIKQLKGIQMKKALHIIKWNLSITAVIYLTIYIATSFIIWDIRNPFQWLIDLPTYPAQIRALILFFYIFYQSILISFINKDFKAI